MSINIKGTVKDALMNFVISEISKPLTNHVYKFATQEFSSSRNQLVGALFEASRTERNSDKTVKRNFKPKKEEQISSPYELSLHSSDTDFKLMYRMDKSTIQILIRIIENQLRYSDESTYPSVPMEKKVLLTCWLLGNCESFSAASKIFMLGKGMIYRIFHSICTELTVLSHKYISWPNIKERTEICESFENIYGFPGVVGVIGLTYIPIKPPESKENPAKFINEDGYSSIALQAVCDDKLIFRDICCGFPGGKNATNVFTSSLLFQKLGSDKPSALGPNMHLLGDFKYPQYSNLLTPYKIDPDQTGQNEAQDKFNHLHEMTRSVIDWSFAALKARYQRLDFIDVTRSSLASKVVIAACTLHNFAIVNGDGADLFLEVEEHVDRKNNEL